MISLGKCFKRFLWRRRDFRFFNLAMLAGKFSIKLSQRINPWSCGKFPTVSGTSVIAFPPIDRICKLETISLSKICIYEIKEKETCSIKIEGSLTQDCYKINIARTFLSVGYLIQFTQNFVAIFLI